MHYLDCLEVLESACSLTDFVHMLIKLILFFSTGDLEYYCHSGAKNVTIPQHVTLV